MRIGILTLELKLNYGGILQAYALQTAIKRMGIDAFVISRESVPLSKTRQALFIIKRMMRKYILRNTKVIIFLEKKVRDEYPIIARNIIPFIERNIQLFEVEKYACLKESDFDAYIVGSDQVWRPRYFKDIENAYLVFAKHWNVKRIAYAPSFGTDAWEYSKNQTLNCKSLIKQFIAVSVRESSGIKLCHEYFDINARKVLDPTMLLNKEDYVSLFEKQNVQKMHSGIFVYYLDDSEFKEAVMNAMVENLRLNTFHIRAQVKNMQLSLEERVQEPVERWIRSFYDAAYILTDSFHACVFSILFNKPFIVCGNKSRGDSRFVSLLAMLGLEKRLVHTMDDAKSALHSPIEWDSVNNFLEKYRKESVQFLNHSINA